MGWVFDGRNRVGDGWQSRGKRGGAERGRCLIGEVYELALSGMNG